jgi:AraC-like DNA-binding protein
MSRSVPRQKISHVAALVGYSSASTFMVAIARHTRMMPSHHARASWDEAVEAFPQHSEWIPDIAPTLPYPSHWSGQFLSLTSRL